MIAIRVSRIAEEVIVSAIPIELVNAPIAVLGIPARATADHVITRSAVKMVVAGSGVHVVIPATAQQDVLLISAEQEVCLFPTAEYVAAVTEPAFHILAAKDRWSNHRWDVTRWKGGLLLVETDGCLKILRDVHVEVGPGHVGGRKSTPQDVHISLTIQCVVAVATDDPVITRARIYLVVGRAGVDKIIAAQAVDGILATEAGGVR